MRNYYLDTKFPIQVPLDFLQKNSAEDFTALSKGSG